MKVCKKCGKELQFSGFERNLITRGKNKGQYKVKYYYRQCDCLTKEITNENNLYYLV